MHRIGRVGRAGREGVAITLAEPREHRLLEDIERVTRQRDRDGDGAHRGRPARAPAGADPCRLWRGILEEDLDRFRAVVEPLSEEFDLMDIALAAVKLAHEAGGTETDEQEIPEIRPPVDDRRPRRERDDRQAPTRGDRTTRVFIGAGRIAGIRPQDIVGAITGESQLSGREIGAIEIADRFTLVEVPDAAADEVIAALRGTSIKGRRPTVRRERYEPGARPQPRRPGGERDERAMD